MGNKNQKITLLAAAFAIFLMLLIPPFYFEPGGQLAGNKINMGYHFILAPPRMEDRQRVLIDSTAFPDIKRPEKRNSSALDSPGPPTWLNITERSEFKSLSLVDRERLREKYWREAMLPLIPPGQSVAARLSFDDDTQPWWEPAIRQWTPQHSEGAAIVDIGMLLTQWLAVLIVAACLWWRSIDK